MKLTRQLALAVGLAIVGAAFVAGTADAKPRHGKTYTEARIATTKGHYRRHSTRRNQRYVRKSVNKHKIRDAAIRNSMRGLERLRPYAINYGRLTRAVRSYWMRNYTRPNASALANTILRHVRPNIRQTAAPQVRASAALGVASVRAALRK